jgi:hypothetical protein
VDRGLNEIVDNRPNEPGYSEVITYEELAAYYAVVGDASKSQEWLVKSFAASPAGIEFRVLESGLFDAVRSNHNFSAAVSAIRGDLYGRVTRLSAAL